MEQLDLPLDYPENRDKALPEVDQSVENFSHETLDVLSGVFNNNFQYGKYSCYKIEVENGKINKVKFKIGDYKLLVYIDYEILKREKPIEKTYLNLKISAIQQKTKVGYGVYKNSVNYFRYTGIDYPSIKSFLEALIKNYHKS